MSETAIAYFIFGPIGAILGAIAGYYYMRHYRRTINRLK